MKVKMTKVATFTSFWKQMCEMQLFTIHVIVAIQNSDNKKSISQHQYYYRPLEFVVTVQVEVQTGQPLLSLTNLVHLLKRTVQP